MKCDKCGGKMDMVAGCCGECGASVGERTQIAKKAAKKKVARKVNIRVSTRHRARATAR